MGAGSQSSGRATSFLNHSVTSPALPMVFHLQPILKTKPTKAFFTVLKCLQGRFLKTPESKGQCQQIESTLRILWFPRLRRTPSQSLSSTDPLVPRAQEYTVPKPQLCGPSSSLGSGDHHPRASALRNLWFPGLRSTPSQSLSNSFFFFH